MVVLRLTNRLLTRAYEAWVSHVLSSQGACGANQDVGAPSRWLRARPLFEVLMCRVVTRLLLDGLLTWHVYARAQRTQTTKLRRAVSRWTGVTAVRCMNAWRELTTRRKDLRRLSSRVAMRLLHRELARAFDRMADHASEVRVLRHKALKAIRVWAGSALARCLYGWRAQVTGEQAARSRVSKAVRHWANRHLVAVFNLWLERVVEQQRSKEIVRRVAQGMSKGGAMRALERWQAWAVEERGLRVKAMRVINRMANGGLCKSLAAWQVQTRQRGMLRKLVLQLMSWEPQTL